MNQITERKNEKVVVTVNSESPEIHNLINYIRCDRWIYELYGPSNFNLHWERQVYEQRDRGLIMLVSILVFHDEWILWNVISRWTRCIYLFCTTVALFYFFLMVWTTIPQFWKHFISRWNELVTCPSI